MREDSSIRAWGSTEEERAKRYPADEAVPDGEVTTCRAIDIDAPPEVVFRWLCQLKKGPYSYDLLDNLGRRSPRKLVPGLEKLERGQQFMTIYELVDFEEPMNGSGQITVRTNKLKGPFGTQAVTYEVTPNQDGGTRLVAKRVLHPPGLPHGPMFKLNLPFIDFVMARRQLLNFKKLAERQVREQG
jgi:uncharacterized protein YndB with AHSA1/START domain